MFACGACCFNQETEDLAVVERHPCMDEGTRQHLQGQVATSLVADRVVQVLEDATSLVVATSLVADGVVQVLSLPREAADEAMGGIGFTAILNKGPYDVIGVDVDWGAMDKLKIKSIKEGLVDKWNSANPCQCVRPGDYIMDINGISGDAAALFQAVKSSQRLVIQITRYPFIN